MDLARIPGTANVTEHEDFVRQVGSQWGVFSKAGKLLGKHATKEEATAQLGAIEAAKKTDALYTPRFRQGFSRVTRNDVMETMGEPVRTPSGGLRVPTNYSRVGVFKYAQPDGTITREFRPPEEVFHPDSIASIVGAPVTILHPPDMVTPETWDQYAVGHAHSAAPNAPFVSGELDVNHADAIGPVEAKQLKEISLGYVADIDPTPGTWNGPNGPEPYDTVQRNIRVNHVAMGPNGWGRQGPSVSLRTDAASGICEGMAEPTRKIHFDGIPYDAGSDSHIEAVNRKVAQLEKRATDAEAEAKTQKERADAAEKATDAKAIAKRVSERTRLIVVARNALEKRARADHRAGKLSADDANRAILSARRYLDAEEEQAQTGDDTIIVKAIQAHCPDFDPSGYSHDQLLGVLAGMSHMSNGGGSEPDGDEMGDDMAGEYDGLPDGDFSGGLATGPVEGPMVPSKDAGMVPQPKGSTPDTTTNAMKPPPKAFDSMLRPKAWTSDLIPRGKMRETSDRRADGSFKHQGTGQKTEEQARAEMRDKQKNAWKGKKTA